MLLTGLIQIAALTLLCASDAAAATATIKPNPRDGRWIDTWATMPQLTEYSNVPPPPFNTTNAIFVNTTIRQTVHITVPASQIRLKISNAFGITNLPITAVTVALPVNGSAGVHQIEPTTLQNVTFSGNSSISIPDGGLAVSDPLNFRVKAQSMLTITLYLETGQTTQSITSHPGSRTTSWWQFGNAVSAPALTITNSTVQSGAHWYFISAVEAWVPPTYSSFAIIGDSITDGRGSDTDKNNRWPDLLLARLQQDPSTQHIAVSNQAAGGNRILADGLGPAAVARVERDVLAHPGVRYAMIFEGVNDIGTADSTIEAQDKVYEQLVQAYQQISARIHAFGIPLFAATITPFSAPSNSTIQPYSTPERSNTRNRINEWIKDNEGTVFDAVIDFAKIVQSSADADMLADDYNSGDYLHPNVKGYTKIAAGFPLGIFADYRDGVDGFM